MVKTSNIKILQSCGSMSWGGLEMYTLRTSCELKDAGHDVTLLCRSGSTLYRKAKEAGLQILPMLETDLLVPRYLTKLTSSITELEIDVIHTHLSHDLWTLVPALKFSGIKPKLFLTKHMGSGVSKTDPFHKYLYRNVNGIFAVSNYVKESLKYSVPIDSAKIHVLPPGIELSKYERSKYNASAVREKFGLPSNSVIFGMAVRMTPGKGHEDLLNAIRLIKQNNEHRIYFVIIGSASYGEESYEAKIRDMVKEYGLESDIKFTGFIDDIPEIFSALDVFVFPSHEESFGFILLEAMAMELPVIASRNAGVLDIVVHDETGILVQPKVPEALAEAVLKLSKNPAKRCELGKAGRSRVETHFGIDNIISKMINYYVSG